MWKYRLIYLLATLSNEFFGVISDNTGSNDCNVTDEIYNYLGVGINDDPYSRIPEKGILFPFVTDQGK